MQRRQIRGYERKRSHVSYLSLSIRDAECKHVVFCDFCFDISSKLLSLKHLFPLHSSLLPPLSPHIENGHYFSLERNHPVISRLEIFENAQRLSGIMREVFQSPSYAKRLCLGEKKTEKKYNWITYENVLKRSEAFAAGREEIERERGTRV